jgi:hypothetical protein
MSRGRTKIFARVSPTLLAAVADAARRRGVDHSTVVRDALAAYLQPRSDPATGKAQATPPPMPAATDLLHSLDPAIRAQLTEGMARFQASPGALMAAILRRWAVDMRNPRRWRGWRP